VAFLAVFLAHANGGVGRGLSENPVLTNLKNLLFGSGEKGVSFFFVLSGFLITYLILYEIEVTGTVDVLAFYMRRLLRIWPLYYLVLFIGFVVVPPLKLSFGQVHGDPWYYLAFLGNFDLIRQETGRATEAMLTSITWSVAIEEQFYLAWPLLLFLVPRKLQKVVFPLIILGSTLFRFAHSGDKAVLYFHTLSVIYNMGTGGLAAYLALKAPWFKRRLLDLGGRSIASIYGLCLAWALLVPPTVASYVPTRLGESFFFAFVVLEQSFCGNSPFRMESFKLASSLGRVSYGLYMLHPLALGLTYEAFGGGERPTDVPAPERLLLGLVAFLATVALSALSYRLYEAPFLRLKRRFAKIATSGADGGTGAAAGS
jgi:peptidoglycan/LPS O-acetylase OafA/YrhL